MKKQKTLSRSTLTRELAQSARDFSYSLAVDHELLSAEVRVSMAHANALAKAGLITQEEAKKLVAGLWAVLRKWKGKDVSAAAGDYEDIHTLVQSELEREAPDVARKLHAGRSRNDLVVTSLRIYTKERLEGLSRDLRSLQEALIAWAGREGKARIPGYTHLQRAQVISLAHYLLAHVEMFERDKTRLADAAERMDEMPLGSGALAGSTLPLDRDYLAQLLGFKRVSANSLDAVSDRDFVVEVLAALALNAVHLSRLAEDLILWSSSEFGFLDTDDAYTTGSSLMPQKKNPDLLELVRGRASKMIGALTSALALLKGLPLAYNRDLQEDKVILFPSLREASQSLRMVAELAGHLRLRKDATERATRDSFFFATDLVDELVRRGVAFADAHRDVGRLCADARSRSRQLSDYSAKELARFSKAFGGWVANVLRPEGALERKQTAGSPNPKQTARALKEWARRLAAEEKAALAHRAHERAVLKGRAR